MITFFYEAIEVSINEETTKKWIQKIINIHKAEIDEINFIFCNDAYLLEINKTYLNHDYYTDIITFDNSIGRILNGEIYISIDTVKENALDYEVKFEEELDRVIIHGILHLIGFKDKTDEEQDIMTKEENKALNER